MKIFNKTENWQEKVNFVDENNVVLGYDMTQSCCEDAGWYINDSVLPSGGVVVPEDHILENESEWVFDTSFNEKHQKGGGYEYDEESVFRIVNTVSGAEKFIHLFNIHNGFYCHGFDFSKDGEILVEGIL